MKKVFLFLTLCLALLAVDKKLEIYESPTCGCCDSWALYMQKNGFKVSIHKSDDFLKIKENFKIKNEWQSCHTGVIEGYAIEGHVPLEAVLWLLENKPKGVIGISAPGMPQGSPGMEQGYSEKYPVIIMKEDGTYELYAYFINDKKLEN